MNIFLIDKDPRICAQALCDLRLNKMILETAQLLCNGYRYWHDEEDVDAYSDIIYKPTHENHPCSLWLNKSILNYQWLLIYFEALYDEKVYRTGKEHLSYLKLSDMLYYTSKHAPMTDTPAESILFDFNCSNIYPSTNNVLTDYKLCLVQKWLNDTRLPKWTNRKLPNFLIWDLKQERKHIQKLSNFEQELYLRQKLTNDPLWEQYNVAA